MAAVSFDRYRSKFFARFPEAANLEAALKTPKNTTPMFFFQESNDPDLKRSWLVLGRLGPEMEASLSINGEVLFLFTPHEEFQRRSFNKLTDVARRELIDIQQRRFGVVRFTPDSHIALIYSKDPSLVKNLRAWNDDRPSSLIARIPTLEGDAETMLSELRKSIATVLASRDLYEGKSPVSGRDFFGRIDTIQAISADLKNERSVGLFGLRRSGKTSLLRELRLREEPGGLVLVLSDLESMDTTEDIPRQISQDLVNVLRQMRTQRKDIWLGPESEHEVTSFGSLSARLIRVAERNKNLLFVVAVDEVEHLRRLARESPERVRLFLGSLRRAAQATKNLSLFLTGLTTEFFDQSMITDEVDNPLFGFIDSHFLPPFTAAESARLVQDLGGLMMLDWTQEALDAVHQLTGGFPFFLRDLCSEVRKVALSGLPGDGTLTTHLKVDRDHVTSAFENWSDGAGKAWSEIVRTLKSYQPIMAEMLNAKTEREVAEWRSIGVEGETAAQSLARLGLLELDSDRNMKQSGSLIALNTLGAKPAIPIAELQSRRDLRALLARREDSTLEFKSTARWNLRRNVKDPAIEDAIVKTVAGFLNSDGGTLVIGVDDNGTPRGISEDLATCRDSLDVYERWLMGSLLSERIGPEFITQHVRSELFTLDGHSIVVVTVSRSDTLAWVSTGDDEELYVRNGNETRQLNGRQAVEFAKRRSGA